jgi:hypothetical protein
VFSNDIKSKWIYSILIFVLSACGGDGGGGGGNDGSGGKTTSNPGTIQFSPSQYSFTENDGNQLLSLTRTDGNSGSVSVSVTIRGGTASQGEDFTIGLGNVSWANGEDGTKTIPVTIINNITPNEGDESFTVDVSLVTGEATLGQSSAEVTIVDVTGTGGVIQFSGVKFSATEDSGNNGAVVTVSRLDDSSGTVTVNYSTSDGTASVDEDYRESSGTLTWADGSTQAKNIFIDILSDANPNEGDETVQIILSDPNGASLGSISTATLTIYDVTGTNAVVPNSYLFYMNDQPDLGKDNGIYGINPTNPGPNMVDTATQFDVGFADTILKSNFHQLGLTVNNTYTYAAVFSSVGSIWRVSGLVDDGPLLGTSPQKISTESNIGSNCDVWTWIEPDDTDIENTKIFYTSGQNCTEWAMVELGWDDTVDPVPVLEPVADITDETGNTIGYLAFDLGSLVRCSTDFQNCGSIVKSNIFSASQIGGATTGASLLYIDDSLYWYDGTQGLSDAIYTFQSGFATSPLHITDGEFQYFVDGSSIYQLKLDGGSSPQALVTESSNTMVSLGLFASTTFDKLIYTISDLASSNSELRALAKDGSNNGVPDVLTTSSIGTISIHAIRNSRIYYNIYPSSGSVSRSGMIMEDGSYKSELNDSLWVGFFTDGASHIYDRIVDKVIRMESGGNISAYESASNSFVRDLGALNSGDDSLLISGNGRYGHGTAFDGATFNRDIYYVDMQTSGSLRNVTASINVDEVNF